MTGAITGEMFTSLSALRAAHRTLQKDHRERGADPATLASIEEFINRARATGAILDDDDDQAAAQSLVDLWANVLYRAGHPVPETTLSPFDKDSAPTLGDDLVPYEGLDPFTEARKDYFFGRERAIEQLLARLRTGNFLAVSGPSGSGKSSLVLAGLVPALKANAIRGSDQWSYPGRMVPGSDPLANLAGVLLGSGAASAAIEEAAKRLRAHPDYVIELLRRQNTETVVLVIDQFEELSTLCDDDGTRQAFENCIIELVGAKGNPRALVIMTMRSDFINAVAREPGLQSLLEDALQPMTPLTAAELREAIERPAQRIGLKFEAGVVEALMHDILGEPAALPLLQFTLLKLWEQREHNRITLDAYRKLGGGRLALTRTADQYIERLLPQDRIMAERILGRLVRPGTGQDNVAQRIRYTSLYSIGPRENVDRVVKSLRDSRLIRVTSGDVDEDIEIEIAHEALLRNWPYLDNLLQSERTRKSTLMRLEVKAAEWVRLGRGKAGLLSDAALAEAEAWLATAGSAGEDATDDLRLFIRKSRSAAEKAIRRQRQTVAVLALLTVASLVFAAIAFMQRAEAKKQARLAQQGELQATAKGTELQAQGIELQNKQKDLQKAVQDRDEALAKAKAAEASEGIEARLYESDQFADAADAILPVDPESAAMSSLQGATLLAAHRQVVAAKVGNALYASAQSIRARMTMPANAISSLAFNPDGSQFATAGKGQPVRIWNAKTGKLIRQINLSEAEAVASSLDGRWAVAGSFGVIVANPGSQNQQFHGHNNVHRLVFSPAGTYLAGLEGSDVIVWKLDGDGTGVALKGATDKLNAIAFSPTGAFIAAAGVDRSVYVWEVAGDATRSVMKLDGHTDAINDVAFSPDGAWIVSASDDGTARYRSLENSVETQYRHSDHVRAVAFTSNGRRLITVTANNLARIWTAGTEREIDHFPLPSGSVFAFNGDATQMTVWDGARLGVWDTSPGNGAFLGSHDSPITGFAAEGNVVVTGASDGLGSSARVWDLSQPGRELKTVIAWSNTDGPISAVALNSTGSKAAIARSSTVGVYDLASPASAQSGLSYLIGRAASLAFSPDGTNLAAWSSIGSSGRLYQWDLQKLGGPPAAQLFSSVGPGGAESLVFSHDGKYLIAAGADGIVRAFILPGLRPAGSFRADSGGALCVAVAPNDKLTAVCGSDNTAQLWAWDPATSIAQRRGSPLGGHKAPLRSLAFNSNGTMIVTGGQDAAAGIWRRMPDGSFSKVVMFATGNNPVSGVSFTADSTRVVVAADDGGVRVFPVPGPDPVTPLLPALYRAFEPGECQQSEICAHLAPAVMDLAAGNAFARVGDEPDARGKFNAARDVNPLLPVMPDQQFSLIQARSEADTQRQMLLGAAVQARQLARAGQTDKSVDLLKKVSFFYGYGINAPSLSLEANKTVASIFVSLATAAANQEDEQRSRYFFGKAASSNPSANLNADAETRKAMAAHYRFLAVLAAAQEDEDHVRENFKKAAAADPSAQLDVDSESNKALLPAVLSSANFNALTGKADSALQYLQRARKYAAGAPIALDTDAVFQNQICWWGSIGDLAMATSPEVRDACGRAVTLTKGLDASERDSRGVNLARNGDLHGAIADFEAFIDDPRKAESDKARRRQWIDNLNNGRNPFTPDELSSLR